MSPFRTLSASVAALTASGALLVTAVAGCDDSATPGKPPPVDPPHRSFDAIPAAPLQGKLRGNAFAMHSARYVIDRRDGYEKIDITLSAAEAEVPCGPLVPADAPSIWLRRKGAQPVEVTELQLAPGDAKEWEVHYQLREKDRWVGSDLAAALLRLKPSKTSATLNGELAVCFADGKQSCIAGSFKARQCPAHLDMPVRGNEPVEQLPPDRKGAASATPDASAPAPPADAGRD